MNFRINVTAVASAMLAVTVGGLPAAGRAQSGELTLDEVVERHQSMLAGLIDAHATMQITYGNPADADAVREKATVSIGPGIEQTLSSGPGGDSRVTWDGQAFDWMLGYDADAVEDDIAQMEKTKANRYRSDLPIQRTFPWRSLRAYRLMANDLDLSLRQLCDRSTDPPRLEFTGGIYTITMRHMGSEDGSAGDLCNGGSILATVDPDKNFLVTQYMTRCEKRGRTPSFSQTLEMTEVVEPVAGLFLPAAVRYQATSDAGSTSQVYQFTYDSVNEGVKLLDSFEPFCLVAESEHHEAQAPLHYFVTDKNGALGQPIATLSQAAKIRYDRLTSAMSLETTSKSWLKLSNLFWLLGASLLLGSLVYYFRYQQD